jgi:hypothetical protein
MSQQTSGKVLLTLAVALSAVVSTLVDLLPGKTGHVFNPEWPAHAIFHDIVMFLMLDWMAIVCLWLLWRKSAEPRVGPLVSLLLVLGFWSPFYYVTVLFPGASLSANPAEMEAVSVVVLGFRLYFNVMIGTALMLMALVGYWLFRRGEHKRVT